MTLTTEEKEAVVEALKALRKYSKNAKDEIHGWKLEWSVRKSKSATVRGDITAIDPSDGQELHSIVSLQRKLGLVEPEVVAPASSSSSSRREPPPPAAKRGSSSGSEAAAPAEQGSKNKLVGGASRKRPLASNGDAASGSSSSSSAKPMCGTFGCILPDNHKGLHEFPETTKRARVCYGNESVSGVIGVATGARGGGGDGAGVSSSSGGAGTSGGGGGGRGNGNKYKLVGGRGRGGSIAIGMNGGSNSNLNGRAPSPSTAQSTAPAAGAAAAAAGRPSSKLKEEQATAAVAPQHDGLRIALLTALNRVRARDASSLLVADEHVTAVSARMEVLGGAASAPNPPSAPHVMCAPPSLFAALERLRAGGYANVAELSGDLDALFDAAGKRERRRAAARREEAEGGDVGAGVGAAGVVSPLGGRSGGTKEEQELVALIRACRDALRAEAARFVSGCLRGPPLADALNKPPPTPASGSSSSSSSSSAHGSALLAAPPPATKPPTGRAWWTATKSGQIVLPPTEHAAILSDVERLNSRAHERMHPPSLPAPPFVVVASGVASSADDGSGGDTAGGTAGGPVDAAGEVVDEEAMIVPSEVGRHLEWSAKHWPSFVPVGVPCVCVVDGRQRCVLLGWTNGGSGGGGVGGGGGEAPHGKAAQRADDEEGGAAQQYAVVSGYFCTRPVQLLPSRCEISIAPAGGSKSGSKSGSKEDGGNAGTEASRVGATSVRWADGYLSSERAARLTCNDISAEASDLQPVEPIESVEARVCKAAPAGWKAVLSHVEASEARAALVRDADAWGFGWSRVDICPRWSAAEARLLEQHVGSAPVTAQLTLLALLAPMTGRSLAYLRQRWHTATAQPLLAPLSRGSAPAAAASSAPAANGVAAPPAAAATGKHPVVPRQKAAAAGGAGTHGCECTNGVCNSISGGGSAGGSISHGGGGGGGAERGGGLSRLGALNAAVSACVWQLADRLGSATPPELWSLMRIEDTLDGGVMPLGVRAQLRHVEERIFELEKKIELTPAAASGGDAPPAVEQEVVMQEVVMQEAAGASGVKVEEETNGASCMQVDDDEEDGEAESRDEPVEEAVSGTAALSAADSRQYVFQIDDITYGTASGAGAASASSRHRLPICAVNEVDDEDFPSIDYLHACIAGEGVCLEMPPEFLVGCTSDGCCSLAGGCTCCAEQVEQTGNVVYDAHGRLRKSFQFGTHIYECNAACACPPECSNRVVQRGISKRIQVR